jgi:hypothetical protein
VTETTIASRLCAVADELDRLAAQATELADELVAGADRSTWSGPAAQRFRATTGQRVFACRDYADRLARASAGLRRTAFGLYERAAGTTSHADEQVVRVPAQTR